MRISFDIDEDQLENFILERLRQDYIDQRTTWKHEEYSKKLSKGLLRVIEYYSIPTEHAKWLKTVKDL